ncbi:MAG: glycoside hydrolase, partial [bacterium]
MKPLKVAILWHFHQPHYIKNDELILPWVRLHAVKDYLDLPMLFHEFPKLKQTINLVPSLTMQIGSYIKGEFNDKIQRLTLKNAKDLTDDDKRQ